MKRVMKNVRKRLGAFALMFAMVMPLVCGAQTEVKAAATPDGTYLKIAAVVNGSDVTTVDLELGDTVTIELRATADLASLGKFSGINGYINYDLETFVPLTQTAMIPADGWAIYWDCDTKRIAINTTSTDGASFADGDVICTFNLGVAKSVNGSVDFGLCGDLNDLDKFVEVTQKDGQKLYSSANVSCSLTNNIGLAGRTFSMSVPTSTTFYTNSPYSDKEVKIPISIDSGSVYSGFKFSFTYNPQLVSYEGYELSSKAGAYVQAITQSDEINNGGLKSRNITLLSAKDINMEGEFIYLKFKTSKGFVGPVTGAYLTVTLYEAVNQSKAPMTYSIEGNSSNTVDAQTVDATILLDFKTRKVFYGDINNDGKVNLLDAIMILQHYNGVRDLSTEEGKNEVGSEYERADVNGSGTVTLVDALLIMKYYNGEIQKFPIEG